VRKLQTTVEVTQPWVTYTYGMTHDLWWPFWNSTRVLGKAKVLMRCIACQTEEVAVLKMPRFRPVEDRGSHPLRTKFLSEHQNCRWSRPDC
jgi:hypothetical protein